MSISNAFKGSVKSSGGATCLFSIEPLGNFVELTEIVETFALGLRPNDELRGPSDGREVNPGPRPPGRRGAGEPDRLWSGGGGPEGVEFPERRSIHMVADG